MEHLSNVEKATLKEIYALLPEEKDYMVRTTLNYLTKHNKIKRIERGVYSKF